jgi:outer membrane protein OmpA-like peptidoglycan-associated protein
MSKAIYIFLLLISGLMLSAAKPETRLLKKAEQSIEKGNLKNAKAYYLRALAKNPESYDANLGLGLMLCELLDNHAGALPYLEKALALSVKDTLKDLAFALAQCYQYKGEFEKAISFYNLLDGCIDYENEIDLSTELQKRKDDCNYAISHKYYPKNPNIFIVNAGRTINTEMPEYVPVLTPKGELIFTSKRKDTESEELNYLDGKYYESMYITRLDSAGFKKVRRYTLPDQFMRSHFSKYHESVLSISPDGTKLFTYRDNKIYEINIEEREKEKPRKLLKTINFNYYQNHAYLSRDGKTLFFTSDASGGYGGNDIYKSLKDEKGQWGKPENLGPTINTPFDEEAPFLSDDGLTLYFSSRGHQGFGNFDIYKSYFLENRWTIPENLGEPVNSPGHDVFMIVDSSASVGYFSSSRNGGFGDMDIYKIIFIDKINKQCPAYNLVNISLELKDATGAGHKNRIDAAVPGNYNVLFSEWKVNGKVVDTVNTFLDYTFSDGKNQVSSRIVALCDTCLVPVISCNSIEHEPGKPAIVASNESLPPTETAAVDLSKRSGLLNREELTSLGFNLSPILFDFNRSELKSEALEILGPNIELLKKHPGLRVEIDGYSDVRGSDDGNRYVSQLRANSVKNCLIKNGVKPSQIISAKGRGASNLVNTCDGKHTCDENAHQQNRRVIFTVRNN